MAHPPKRQRLSPESEARRLAAWRKSGAAERSSFKALNKSRAGTPLSEEHKAKIASANKGKSGLWMKGRAMPEKTRRKISDYWSANRETHNHYRDGKGHERSSARTAAMQRLDYRLWREAVFARDNHSCVMCGTRGGRLHANHIRAWAVRPDLRYVVDNGETLCVPCHKITDSFGSNVWKSAAAREIFTLSIGG